MRFALDDDQLARRDVAEGLLRSICTTAEVRASWQTSAVSRTRWQRLADVGLLSVALPASHGGLGGGDVDVVVLLEEAGAVALPEPLGAAIAASRALADAVPEATQWIERFVAGDAVLTGGAEGDLVPHAGTADVVVTVDGEVLRAFERGAAALEAQPTIDGGRPVWRVRSPGAANFVAPHAAAAALARDRLALYAAAELVGVGRRSLDLAVAYAKERVQFGRPIGSYQALKHRLADDWIALEFARPLVWRAAWSLTHGLPDASLHVSAAKAAAGDAALGAARTAVQVHGAMGYTLECDVQLFLKRALSLASSYGTAHQHRRRLACALRVRDIARVP